MRDWLFCLSSPYIMRSLIRNFLNAEKLYGADRWYWIVVFKWVSEEPGVKNQLQGKTLPSKKSGGGSQRFFSLDDETVLQKTVGQDGESLSVGWCEAEHYVAKPERHMNRGTKEGQKICSSWFCRLLGKHALKVAAGVRMKRHVKPTWP